MVKNLALEHHKMRIGKGDTIQINTAPKLI